MLSAAIKAPVLAMIAKQYKNPKAIFANCDTQELTIVDFDGTQRKETAGFSQHLKKVAKAYGFKTIEKIGIEFDLQAIMFKGTDKTDKPKTLKI